MKLSSILKCTLMSAVLLFASQQGQAYETYVQFAKRLSTEGTGSANFRPELEATLLSLANQYRSTRGVGPLAANPSLILAARAHAMDMALHDFVGHVSSKGRNFSSRMSAFYPGQIVMPSLAENAARASDGKVQSVMMQWIKNAPHRKALSSRTYVSVATAVVQRGKKLYAVQIFSGPAVQSNMQFDGNGTGLY